MSAIDKLNNVDYSDAIQHGTVIEVSESILTAPFWKPWFCQMVIDAADEHNNYHPLYADVKGTAPGQECRINEFSPWLFERYKEHWMNILRWPVGEFYQADYLFNRDFDMFRVPFLVKYTMDTQRSMDQHHDFSVISMSMMLNGDYEGNYLWFPRQRWSNQNVPIGYATIFPGQLTHPHCATRLLTGNRYGLTGWIRGEDLKNVDP